MYGRDDAISRHHSPYLRWERKKKIDIQLFNFSALITLYHFFLFICFILEKILCILVVLFQFNDFYTEAL